MLDAVYSLTSQSGTALPLTQLGVSTAQDPAQADVIISFLWLAPIYTLSSAVSYQFTETFRNFYHHQRSIPDPMSRSEVRVL